jgi:uncharacterized protein YjiS (DUF1127 family)
MDDLWRTTIDLDAERLAALDRRAADLGLSRTEALERTLQEALSAPQARTPTLLDVVNAPDWVPVAGWTPEWLDALRRRDTRHWRAQRRRHRALSRLRG